MLTFGHGRLERAELGELLAGAGVEAVVDVRRFPGSRANPAAARGAIPDLLTQVGIAYRWDERLGGRRSLTKAQDEASPDTWWRVKAFRAYAAWTRSPQFRAGAQDLWELARSTRTAVMCSEAVWWRCHRRLIADVTELEGGLPVLDLMHDGRLLPHEPSAGARLGPGGVVWDGDPDESESTAGR
ncbi:MAG: DUF488 domain-containing protein [Micrococcales bacterium]|nr:DUF488 domain-containing protein [Micrococcales bacterium]